MRTVIKPDENIENFYGSPLNNYSSQNIPIDVAEQAAKLRQMLVDYRLNVSVTVDNLAEDLEVDN